MRLDYRLKNSVKYESIDNIYNIGFMGGHIILVFEGATDCIHLNLDDLDWFSIFK